MPTKSSKKRKRVARKAKVSAKKRKKSLSIIYVNGEENAKDEETESMPKSCFMCFLGVECRSTSYIDW